jgi:hypothetical protein
MNIDEQGRVFDFVNIVLFFPSFAIDSELDRLGIFLLAHIGNLWIFLLGRPDIALGLRLPLAGLQRSRLYHTAFFFFSFMGCLSGQMGSSGQQKVQRLQI